MSADQLSPDDIRWLGTFVNALVAGAKKDEAQGNMAEWFFLVGMALGHERADLVEEARGYVKYTRGETLEEMVKQFTDMFQQAIANIKK